MHTPSNRERVFYYTQSSFSIRSSLLINITHVFTPNNDKPCWYTIRLLVGKIQRSKVQFI